MVCKNLVKAIGPQDNRKAAEQYWATQPTEKSGGLSSEYRAANKTR